MVPFNVSSLSSRLGKRDRFHHYVQPRCQKGGRKTRRTDRGKATYMEEYVFLCARRISTHGKSEEEAQKMSFPPSPLSPPPLASLAPGGSILKAICHFLPLPSSRRPFLKFLLHFSLPLLYVFSSYGLLLGLGAAMVRETSYLMLSQVRGIYHERLHKTVHMFFFFFPCICFAKTVANNNSSFILSNSQYFKRRREAAEMWSSAGAGVGVAVFANAFSSAFRYKSKTKEHSSLFLRFRN